MLAVSAGGQLAGTTSASRHDDNVPVRWTRPESTRGTRSASVALTVRGSTGYSWARASDMNAASMIPPRVVLEGWEGLLCPVRLLVPQRQGTGAMLNP